MWYRSGCGRALALLVATVVVSACGGGGGGSSNAQGGAPAQTYTVGGTVSGLSGAGLTLTLVAVNGTNNTQSSQTVTVAAGASSFTFPTAYALAATAAEDTIYEISVTTQPTDANSVQNQTCLALNAYGFVHAAGNITNVQVSCIANTASTLQGVYQVYQNGAASERWFAFTPDGKYLFGVVSNNSSCPNNGNGVDLGTYNWNATTGALTVPSTLVYSPAPCGLTNASGAVTNTAVLTRTGSGGATVLSLVINGNAANAYTLVPVASSASSLLGAFTISGTLDQGVTVFQNDGYYVNLNPQTDSFSGALPGIEYGCYTSTNTTISINTTSSCAGAVETAGTGGFSGGTASSGSFTYALPDANTVTYMFGTDSLSYTRLVPNTASTTVVPSGYTVGGTITGLSATGSPLTLQLVAIDGTNNTESTQTISVPAGATSFTFPTGIALAANAANNNIWEVQVAGQPTGAAQTCVATNAYGLISSASNITSVQVSCIANPVSPLQGFYQLFSDPAGTQPLTKWFAFAPDGTYLFADIQNTNTCLENGNGVDYGAYSWNPATGALVIETAAVYSLAPCGFTNGAGAVDTGVTRTLTRSGSGSATVLTVVTTNSSGTTTLYALPVAAASNSIVGAFTMGAGLDQGLVVFGNNGYYLVVNPQNDPVTGSGEVAGVEYGCYTAAGGVVNFDTSSTCAGAVETAGLAGFSGGTAITGSFAYATPFSNSLQLTFGTYSISYASFLPN